MEHVVLAQGLQREAPNRQGLLHRVIPAPEVERAVGPEGILVGYILHRGSVEPQVPLGTRQQPRDAGNISRRVQDAGFASVGMRSAHNSIVPQAGPQTANWKAETFGTPD